jgi:hypothetical protein
VPGGEDSIYSGRSRNRWTATIAVGWKTNIVAWVRAELGHQVPEGPGGARSSRGGQRLGFP